MYKIKDNPRESALNTQSRQEQEKQTYSLNVYFPMVVHAFNPGTSGGRDKQFSMSLRPAWTMWQVSGQPGLHSEILPK